MENYLIQQIGESSFMQLKELLKENDLPISDIGRPNQVFYGIFDNEFLIASVGIEQYNNVGLLRSLAVKSDMRNRGLGKLLFNKILDFCLHSGVKTLYLLTTTAIEYFGKLGWNVIHRDLVPYPVLQSKEFSSLCPSNAVCMQLNVYMDNIDYSSRIFAAGFNCAQAVFVPYAVSKCMKAKDAFQLTTGFGAGMVYRGEICGAITGAMMAIGMEFGRSQASDTAARDKTYMIINKLYDKFSDLNGTIICKKLLNADISKPEELKRAGMAGVFTTLCPKFVKDAATITDLLIKEYSE